MTDQFVCWKCGASLSDLPLPLARRAECPACHGELHVCRMCRHYDPGKAKQCREPMAEEVMNKTRANFCDWFQARLNTYIPAVKQRSDDARKALDDLFGGANDAASNTPSDLERLFGK